MNDYLDSCDAELSQSHLYRLFALGCFDLIVTLSISVTNLVFNIMSDPPFIFYQGWTLIHSDWEPALIPKSIWSADKLSASSVYWDEWINPFLAFVFFALFGITSEAREEYRRIFRFLRRPFAIRKADIKEEVLPDAVFERGKVTDATNISGRYVIIRFPTCKHSNLNHIALLKQMFWHDTLSYLTMADTYFEAKTINLVSICNCTVLEFRSVNLMFYICIQRSLSKAQVSLET